MQRIMMGAIVGLVCYLSSGGSPCAAHQATIESTNASLVMEVRYFDRGKKDARHAYKFHLIQELLEVTRAEYDKIVAEKQAEMAKSRRGRGN